MPKKLTKGSRIVGDRRTALTGDYVQRYEGGDSIRKIAQDSGRSYGFVHGVLSEAGLTLRSRGGATRGPKRSAGLATASGKKSGKQPTAQHAEAAPAPARKGRERAVGAKVGGDQGGSGPSRGRKLTV